MLTCSEIQRRFIQIIGLNSALLSQAQGWGIGVQGFGLNVFLAAHRESHYLPVASSDIFREHRENSC